MQGVHALIHNLLVHKKCYNRQFYMHTNIFGFRNKNDLSDIYKNIHKSQ